jgi:hypothetical protein
MIEFDVDMGYLLEEGELDCVMLNDENGEHEPMEFVPKLENETYKVSYEQDGIPRCSECQNVLYDEYKDSIKNYCDECGRKVMKQ